MNATHLRVPGPAENLDQAAAYLNFIGWILQ
jgi:hypothetical protein